MQILPISAVRVGLREEPSAMAMPAKPVCCGGLIPLAQQVVSITVMVLAALVPLA